jgi:hypothetical protein
MPLNSFKVLTIAKSSISVTLYFCCAVESFLLKNVMGLFYCVITAPISPDERSMHISHSLELSGYAKVTSHAMMAFMSLYAF